jgi:hypothetical protein
LYAPTPRSSNVRAVVSTLTRLVKSIELKSTVRSGIAFEPSAARRNSRCTISWSRRSTRIRCSLAGKREANPGVATTCV